MKAKTSLIKVKSNNRVRFVPAASIMRSRSYEQKCRDLVRAEKRLARRNEADILGKADPELLKLMAAGLLGYGGYNAMKD